MLSGLGNIRGMIREIPFCLEVLVSIVVRIVVRSVVE